MYQISPAAIYYISVEQIVVSFSSEYNHFHWRKDILYTSIRFGKWLDPASV